MNRYIVTITALLFLACQSVLAKGLYINPQASPADVVKVADVYAKNKLGNDFSKYLVQGVSYSYYPKGEWEVSYMCAQSTQNCFTFSVKVVEESGPSLKAVGSFVSVF